MEMVMLFFLSTITTTMILYLLHRRRCCTTPLSMDWPILGMLPTLLFNAWRLNDSLADALKQKGGTAEFMGPWFDKMIYLLTSDHMNVHHVLVKSFDNYVKGPDFCEIFKPFGDGNLTADSETWRQSRSMYHSLLKNKSFETFVEKTTQNKVGSSLLPVLDHVQQQGMVVNIQDVFRRLTFDISTCMFTGHDFNCLSKEFPIISTAKAFDELLECMMYRNIAPDCVWKLQEWLQIGQEKKLTKACKTFEEFIYARIASKHQEVSKCKNAGEAHFDLLTTVLREEKYKSKANYKKFLRDTAFELFLAGRDTIASTLTWFIWLVLTNPSVETKILQEIKEKIGSGEKMKNKVLGREEVKNLIYLHGALCETLRLFPPIPLERKQPIKSDILPTGHQVNPNTIIFFSFYGMGRSEQMWGKDCLEFKPERWISEKGEVIHVPSHKFTAFNAGPRTCLGKDFAFIQLKIVATAILSNYCLQLVEDQEVVPSLSIILLMKHGLKVRITKREV